MKFILSVLIVLLVGCASQIMKSYIGKDIRQVVVDYGPPQNAFDMGDGRRAFQWIFTESRRAPTTATTTGTVNGNSSSAWINTNTTITGGHTINAKCVYTLFTRWNNQSKAWYVNDYNQPSLRCQ